MQCAACQVVDSGLDETSCFFADDDGLQVEHGHLFEGYRNESDGSVSIVLEDYSFAYDMSRRKVGYSAMQVRNQFPFDNNVRAGNPCGVECGLQ